MPDSINTAAFILGRRPYREHDALVDLYTLSGGKLSLLARGIKKAGSKLAGHIEPLTLADVMIVPGRGLDYLASAVTTCSYNGIRQDLNKLYYAGQVLKLIREELTEGAGDNRIFYLLGESLALLDAAGRQTADWPKERGELWLSVFILKFLSLSGYEPNIKACLSCRFEPMAEKEYYLDLLNKGLVCQACYLNYLANNKLNKEHILKVSYNCLKILKWALVASLAEVMRLRPNSDLSREGLAAVRKFLEYRN